MVLSACITFPYVVRKAKISGSERGGGSVSERCGYGAYCGNNIKMGYELLEQTLPLV